MSCQHPYCFRPVHSICTNHCHWSLCEEHIDEHRKLLLTEFEEVLGNLVQPIDKLSSLVDSEKQNITKERQNVLNSLNEAHQKRINLIEQRFIKINEFQSQHNRLSKHLMQVKADENVLTQKDFQQIEILLNEINQLKHSLIDKEEEPTDLQQIQTTHNRCPLTSLNIYGLSSTHNVPLCCPTKKIRNLFEHLRNYHHLKDEYTNELLKAIELNLDPTKTKLFPSNTKIITIDDKYPCILHDTSEQSRIHRTPCSDLVTKRFLPIHLKTVHRLRIEEINKLMQNNT